MPQISTIWVKGLKSTGTIHVIHIGFLGEEQRKTLSTINVSASMGLPDRA